MMGACFLVLLCLLANCARGARVNRTIDDTNGDSETGVVPVYQPMSAWDGTHCARCAIQPSPSSAFDGTWMAATYNPTLGSTNISFSFEGVALYVYFILANNEGSGITTRTECNFTLDDERAGLFTHTPSDITTALEYNALAFSVAGLEQRAHSVLVSTSGVDYNVFVSFDYAVYTYDEDAAASGTASSTSTSSSATSSSSHGHGSSSSTGAIVGGVVGGLAAALGVGLAILFFLKRRRRYHNPNHEPPMSRSSPYNDNAQSLLPLTEYNYPAFTTPSSSSSEYTPMRSSSYIPQDVVSSLPSGAIVMSAAASSSSLPPGAAPPASPIDPRRTRLQAQMRAIQNEMAQTPGGRDEEMDELKAQIAALRQQMNMLQWASDGPPPGYTPPVQGGKR
ncbi:hypothetical protein CPB85DRAFT_18766 [Mucidula mucida]|nr:hypothetical protein CPB85DRAFT_18766 [Mucidula mucida]